MAGYTKLFSSIIHSTIWRAPDHVRLVWVSMMAMADKHGVVEASVPGLADAARVTLQQCEDALEMLMAPDKYSRTKAHEGRRIEVVAGGWALLNHALYRQMLSDEDRKARGRERTKRWRASQASQNVAGDAPVTPVTPGDAGDDIQKQKQKQNQTQKQEDLPDAPPAVVPPKPPRKRKPRAKKPEPIGHPDHKATVAFYFDKFERQRGCEPAFGGREGKAVQTLLVACGSFKRAQQAIRAALAPGAFPPNATIIDIAKDPSRYLGKGNGQQQLHGTRAGDLAGELRQEAITLLEEERRHDTR